LIGHSLQSSEVHIEDGQSLGFSSFKVSYIRGPRCVTKCDRGQGVKIDQK